MGSGSPYAPHSNEERAAMLEAIGVEDEADLFDIPESIRFDGSFDIQSRSEREIRSEIEGILDENEDVVEFLGRGHYDHYVPAVVDDLAQYLPRPHVRESTDGFEYDDPAKSIGKVHGYYGNWPVLLRAYAYIARLGDEGLTDASATAVLNANYLASRIDYEVPYGPFHHEFVASAGEQDAADVAKRMLDYGVHPPTTKWPEIVGEAMMTEPTEIESKRTLDQLADAFDAVAGEDDATLAGAPERTSTRRIDQVSAARDPVLSWQAMEEGRGACRHGR